MATLEQKRAKLEAELAKVITAQKELDRRNDTRRKVVLGGTLIDLARRDPTAAKLLAQLVDSLTRPADKQVFQGWKLPAPPAARPGPEIER